MNRWDLSTIYPSFESDAFQGDLAKLKEYIEQLNKIELTDDFAKCAEQYIVKANQTLELIYPLSIYAHLTFAVDSADQTAMKYVDVMGNLQSSMTEPSVKFQKWVATFSEADILGADGDLLKEHRFFLMELHENAQYMLSDREEILLSKLRQVGSTAWEHLMSKLTGDLQAEIEVDGERKQLTLSMLRNLATHKDGAVRKRAYQIELEAYKKVDESIAAALNGIKGEVITISKMRGFDSALHEAVHNSRLDMATLDAMLTAMKEKLPSFRKYLRRKAKLLGHENGLPFYDLFAPINESGTTYSYEEAKQFVLDNFGSFGAELKQSAKDSFDNRWIDVEPRKGKRGGAFCAPVLGRKQSRIMLNFDGSFDSVSTMAHELGHGYHNRQLFDEYMLLADYPMPLAETASIFCETIVSNAAIAKADKDEAIFLLEQSLMGSTQVIVDILSRFLFEKSLFEHRQEGPLSVDKMKQLMLTAQREAYGDGLDENYLHPYMWACKPHYYSATENYYNYPYAFGLLFALGLYAEYKSGRENFIADYNQLLKNTTRMKAKDVAAGIGIDITKKDFWLASLGIIEKQIEQFIELTE